jgi:hypothetical protein
MMRKSCVLTNVTLDRADEDVDAGHHDWGCDWGRGGYSVEGVQTGDRGWEERSFVAGASW